MAETIYCGHCGLAFQVAEPSTAKWLTCPRCQWQIRNLSAFRPDLRPFFTWTGVVGTLLLFGANLGWCCGCQAIGWHRADPSLPGEPSAGILLFLHSLSCVFLLLAGVLLLRAGEHKETRWFLVGGAVAAGLAAVTLLATSGLLVIFVRRGAGG
jgi:hypothetical protein